MQEALLHYLWQFQYFGKKDLCTTDGESIQIFNPGFKNTNSGPDFFNARIKIGSIEWVGNIEIHINASGWLDHKHDKDPAYENVVLHVVWKNDKAVKMRDGSLIPTLELKNRVDESLLLKYSKLINSPEIIPCAGVFHKVDDLLKLSMLDKSLMSRLETKAQLVLDVLQRTNNDWEEVCYQLLCKNFGFKVNADPFSQLAQSLPYKTLLKHANKLLHIESMLFGQAGFLENKDGDAYYNLLHREYSLLSQKYQLTGKRLNRSQWKFLRLRPANFPTIRLAQLATLLYQQKNIFSKIIAADSIGVIRKILGIQQSAYWLSHYQFGKQSKEQVSSFGEMSEDNVIVNTIVPILVAYSKSKDDQLYMDRAIDILQHIKTEDNSITRKWLGAGLKCKSAFDSQGLLELNNNFCVRRRCLECTIGASLINPA